MAKRDKAAQSVPDENFVEYIETGDELQAALSKLMAEAGTSETDIDAVAHVYLVEAGGEEPKIWKGGASEYDLDKLAREHGTGNYRLKVYVRDEASQQYRLRINKVFPYRLSAEADARLRDIRAGKVQVPPSQGGNGGAGVTVLTAADVARIVSEQLQALRPQSDPMQMLTALAGVVGKMMPAQSQPVANTVQDGLNMALTLMRTMKELNGDDGGGARGGRSAGDAAMLRGVDLLARMVEKHMDGATPAQNGKPAQPGQRAIPAQVIEMTADEKEDYEMMQLALRTAVRAARNNDDPGEFVQDFGSHVPLPMIAELYGNPQWFDVICANVPEAAKYPEWFNKVRAALIQQAQEAGELTADGKIVDSQGDGTVDAGTGTGAGVAG